MAICFGVDADLTRRRPLTTSVRSGSAGPEAGTASHSRTRSATDRSATLANWRREYMRCLLSDLLEREKRSSPLNRVEVIVPPHVFQVPEVLDFLYSRRQFATIADHPLDQVVREWDVPVTRDDDGKLLFTPTPKQVAMMTEPRLRLVPEGLQHDIPMLRAISDQSERMFYLNNCFHDMSYRVTAGPTVALIVISPDLSLLDPLTLVDLVELAYECGKVGDHGYEEQPFRNLIPIISSVCSQFDGGSCLSLKRTGMAGERMETAVAIAAMKPPKALPGLSQPPSPPACPPSAEPPHVSLQQQELEFDPIVSAVVQRLAHGTIDTEHRQRLLATVLLHAALDQPSPLGAAAHRALSDLPPHCRVHLFALAALIPPPETSCSTLVTPSSGWTLWQVALDYLLPDSVDGVEDGPMADELLAHMISNVSQRCPATEGAMSELAAHAAVTADQVSVWAFVKLAIVVPAYVTSKAVYSAQSPTWLWRVRADALSTGQYLPPISNWKMLLAAMLGKQCLPTVREHLRCL
ncbi:hypothetical protein BC828DRAFT_407302 [Blastocladiella britannica]|nr:hypothetical protein BC828DRAFT_407302 [Blastocladiella britannica]